MILPRLKLQAFLLDIPNIAHSSTPTGSTEADNVVLKEWGTAKNFDFPVKDHVDLTAKSKQIKVSAQGVGLYVLLRSLFASHLLSPPTVAVGRSIE